MTSLKRRSGFVLLMVLVVLVIAATILTSVARRSAQAAMDAGRAQRELQVRWGARSSAAVVLPQADDLLRRSEALEGDATQSGKLSVTLGGVEFRMYIEDEQAKADVNTLAARNGLEELEPSLRRLSSGGRLGVPVILRKPAAPEPWEAFEKPGGGGLPKGRYVSLDEVFAFEHPSELMEDEGLGLAVKQVTCWSDGRVNFTRATSVVLREVLAGLLDENQIYELERFKEQSPDGSLEEALSTLKLEKEQLQQARRLLTDNSHCQSVWVVAKGLTRDWYRLYVVRQNKERREERRWRFEW